MARMLNSRVLRERKLLESELGFEIPDYYWSQPRQTVGQRVLATDEVVQIDELSLVSDDLAHL